MAKSLNLATLVTLAIAATLFQHSAATTFTVGDSYGWKADSTGTVYKTWASSHTFDVGDVLVFDFTSGYHTVAKVIKESYEKCDIDNPIELIQTGPASITLNETGEAYFICTVDQHCIYDQKLAINVKALTSSPPSSPPSIEPTSSPPTPSPDTNAPALAPEGPAPTTSDMAPSSAATPPALAPAGPAPTGSTTAPPPDTTLPALGPSPAPTGSTTAPPPATTPPARRSPPPTGLDTPEPPTSPPPEGPSTSPPPASGATRTDLASIFTIFISAAFCFLF